MASEKFVPSGHSHLPPVPESGAQAKHDGKLSGVTQEPRLGVKLLKLCCQLYFLHLFESVSVSAIYKLQTNSHEHEICHLSNLIIAKGRRGERVIVTS